MGNVNESMSIYQIVTKGRDSESNEFRNVHHYEFFSYVPTTVQLQEAIDAIDTAYKSNLQLQFDSGVEFYAYDVRRVDLGNLPTVEFQPTAAAWFGTAAGDRIPNQVAALCTWKAQTTFPRTTRSYLFPFGEGSNNAIGRWQTSTLTDIIDFGDDMLELVITGDLNADKQAVEYSGTPRIVSSANDVTEVVVTNKPATQRRRRPGVGI